MNEFLLAAAIFIGAVSIGIYEAFSERRAISAAKRRDGGAQ